MACKRSSVRFRLAPPILPKVTDDRQGVSGKCPHFRGLAAQFCIASLHRDADSCGIRRCFGAVSPGGFELVRFTRFRCTMMQRYIGVVG